MGVNLSDVVVADRDVIVCSIRCISSVGVKSKFISLLAPFLRGSAWRERPISVVTGHLVRFGCVPYGVPEEVIEWVSVRQSLDMSQMFFIIL